MGGQTTCYTFEAALEKAIDLETSIFKQFLISLRIVKNRGAREILKDAAAEELKHKQYLEKSYPKKKYSIQSYIHKCFYLILNFASLTSD